MTCRRRAMPSPTLLGWRRSAPTVRRTFPEDRWRQAIVDATAFTPKWATQAQAFGWTARDLFGLPDVPDRPRASYQRLSRYDRTGLVWLLKGRRVIELT